MERILKITKKSGNRERDLQNKTDNDRDSEDNNLSKYNAHSIDKRNAGINRNLFHIHYSYY